MSVDTAQPTYTVKVSGLPAGLSYDSARGLIVGTPRQLGKSQITVVVAVGRSAIAQSSFTLTIDDIFSSPHDLAAERQPGGGLLISWQPPEYPGTTTVSRYKVTVTDAKGTQLVQTIPASQLSATYSSVSSSALDVEVVAYGANGRTSQSRLSVSESPRWAQISVDGHIACGSTVDGIPYCSDFALIMNQGLPIQAANGLHRAVFEDITVAVPALGIGKGCVIRAGDVLCGRLVDDGTETPTLKKVDVPPASQVIVVGRSVGGTWEDQGCSLSLTGEVWCWTMTRTPEGDVIHAPKGVEGLAGISRIVSSRTHTCALGTDGSISCWGSNVSGELGRTTGEESEPGLVDGFSGAIAVSVGTARGGNGITRAVTDAAYCWGDGSTGVLGTGVDSSAVPVRIPGTEGASDVTVGVGFACVLKSGRVLCWGRGDYGELGQGEDPETGSPSFSSTTPVEVKQLPYIKTPALSAGSAMCAIDTTERLWCWGGEFTD